MKIVVLIFVAVTLCGCHGNATKESVDEHLSNFLADMWVEGADVLRILWRDCSKKLVDAKDVIDVKEYFPKFMKCMKRKTLRALDRSLTTDIVPIADGVNLVRYEMVDRSGNVMNNENDTSNAWTEKELDEGDWRTLAMQRMAKILRTHVLKLDISEMKNSPEKAEFRHRRRQQMMTMMMFGVVSIGMVLIPMGFQFLAVLGGKALLLAKMALILASIQGLKKVDDGHGYDKGKIATSPVSYGFYHSYPPYDHYEKRSHSDWPSPSIMPATAPPPLPRHNLWPAMEASSVKFDRSNIVETKDQKHIEAVTWRPEISKRVNEPSETRLYPVYSEPEETSSAGILTSLDAPTPLSDHTTLPGEVQADYSIDLPYNRIHFQSPSALVSS